jgi:acyl carrier protein
MPDPRANEILDIVATETAVDRGRLVPDALLSDLGIPSLDLVQAIFAIEERFKVDIPVVSDRTGAEFQMVGDLVSHVLATLGPAPAMDLQPGA